MAASELFSDIVLVAESMLSRVSNGSPDQESAEHHKRQYCVSHVRISLLFCDVEPARCGDASHTQDIERDSAG